LTAVTFGRHHYSFSLNDLGTTVAPRSELYRGIQMGRDVRNRPRNTQKLEGISDPRPLHIR
ncbi:MAG: hypothetical protein VW865_13040, partial [Halieaceae bacterium]